MKEAPVTVSASLDDCNESIFDPNSEKWLLIPLTQQLIVLHRQASLGRWSDEHYQKIADAHKDQYPKGYLLWMNYSRRIK